VTPATGVVVKSDRSDLVTRHLDLVDAVVAALVRRLPFWTDREELTASGRLGLIEAAERFDPCLGVPFGAYARLRIEGAALDSVRAADWVPVRIRAVERRIELAESGLRTTLRRNPDEAEVCAASGVTLAELRTSRRHATEGRLRSIDERAAPGTSGSRTVGDDVAAPEADGPEARFEHDQVVAGLRAALDRLPPRHRVAIGTFLGERRGMDAAAQLGVSSSRVSQLRAEGLRMLRDLLEADIPPPGPRPVPQAAAG
jgi:RNA polymerase sigma factor for flagellar operon FliA